MFFLNISIIIADINAVRTILCSEISPAYCELFFKIFSPKKMSPFARRPKLPIHKLNIRVKFSEIKVPIDA